MTRDDIISLSTLDLSDPLDAKIQELVLTVYDRGKADGAAGTMKMADVTLHTAEATLEAYERGKADGEREALQWAANVCDEYARMCRNMGRDYEIADNLATHIRALKTP
jgi:1,6-anhydro-N-acetylmuramate kinase